MAETNPRISFVIPSYNESASLGELVGRIREHMKPVDKSFEILVVDDGSTDDTEAVLGSLIETHPELVSIHLRRNFGKAAALCAGFAHSSGDIIFTLDADLQDDPIEIPSFLAEIKKGFDLVSGWKVSRQDPLGKTLPSKVFNWVVATFSGLSLHDFNCGYKCYRREVLEQIRLYGELHRFIPALAHARGFKVGEIEVRHQPRAHGESKYGLERLPRGVLDFLTVMMITRFPRTAIHAFGLFGAGLLLTSTLLMTGLFARPLIVGEMGETRHIIWLATILAVAGGQMLLFGLLADLLSRSFPPEHHGNVLHTLIHRESRAESP